MYNFATLTQRNLICQKPAWALLLPLNCHWPFGLGWENFNLLSLLCMHQLFSSVKRKLNYPVWLSLAKTWQMIEFFLSHTLRPWWAIRCKGKRNTRDIKLISNQPRNPDLEQVTMICYNSECLSYLSPHFLCFLNCSIWRALHFQ